VHGVTGLVGGLLRLGDDGANDPAPIQLAATEASSDAGTVPEAASDMSHGSDSGVADAGASHTTDMAAASDDAGGLPGVSDVLDLGSSLLGVIVPKVDFVGQAHFETEEHHDVGNSHGSLLNMLV
jgi:hypothetical protein